MRLIVGLVPFTLLITTAVVAQQPSSAPPPCAAAEHRQFDFWLGEWDVTTPDGRTAGTNRITSILNGCVLLEEWTGAGGGIGKSFNLYDARAKHWRQTWIDGRGNVLELRGGLSEAGAMVMTGESPAPNGNGTILNRITWTRGPGEGVRQHWESSSDSGKTWTTTFDGTYRKP